jgi:glycosyltransferase involved in cell wall biosynthesis
MPVDLLNSFHLEQTAQTFRLEFLTEIYDRNMLDRAIDETRKKYPQVQIVWRNINLTNSELLVWSKTDLEEVVTDIFSQVNNYPNFYQNKMLAAPKNLDNKRPNLSCIIVLTQNEKYLLNQAIPALFKNTQKCPFEVIIVNNDQYSKKKLFEHLPVLYIDAPDAFGVSRAYNLGIKQAQGDYLAIFHDDACVLDEYWAEKCITVINSTEFVFLSSETNKKKGLGYYSLASSTPLVMFKRKLIQKFGYFDENIYIGCEELEYNARLNKAGIPIKLVPCVVFHLGAGSTAILDSFTPEQTKQLIALNIFPRRCEIKEDKNVVVRYSNKIHLLAAQMYFLYLMRKYFPDDLAKEYHEIAYIYFPNEIKDILDRDNTSPVGNEIFNKFIVKHQEYLKSESFRPILKDNLEYLSIAGIAKKDTSGNSDPKAVLFFSLGGDLSENYIRAFILAREKYPEWFRLGLEITSVYGSFPGLIWNGGRVVNGQPLSWEAAASRVSFFNRRNIGVNFTFTNCLLTAEHIQDKIGNEVLKRFESSLNAVIVNSPLLEEHVRRNYPHYKIISSVTKCIYDKEKLIADTEKYDLVVIPPEFNLDLDFLRILPPDKVELLLNEGCPPYCAERRAHYICTSKICLGQISYEDKICSRYNPCQKVRIKPPGGTMVFSLNKAFYVFAKTGIKNFKFNSRGNPDLCRVTQELTKYFVRPECRIFFGDYLRDNAADQEQP